MPGKHLQPSSKVTPATANLPAARRVQRLALLGPPLLLEREDLIVYDELLSSVCAAVRPADAIEEILVADVVYYQWELLGLRRLKSNIVKKEAYQELRDFLRDALPYDQISKKLEKVIASEIEYAMSEDQDINIKKLAHECILEESDAIDKLDELLHEQNKS